MNNGSTRNKDETLAERVARKAAQNDAVNARAKAPAAAPDISDVKPRRALRQQRRVKDAAPAKLIAYDFETSRIKAGTPEPVYLTAYGLAPDFAFEGPISSVVHLRDLLVTRFLVAEHIGVMFVAWFGNGFDAYFVAAALLHSDEFVIRPYLTKSNQLRGMRVIHAEDINLPSAEQRSWEFLDGMAMLGSVDKLGVFLDRFAPEYRKLSTNINFETEEFDPSNPDHRAYAMRDSVGLYHGMIRAQQIMLDNFNQPLTVTVGNAAIKVFKANMPADVAISPLSAEVEHVTRSFVMRGGFCYCARPHDGPVWKYDLNQAYAAAMRESWLPQGKTMHCSHGINRFAVCYIARVTASNPHNLIPFYHRVECGRIRAVFALHDIADTWLTSIEVEQLQREGWHVTIHESHCWEGYFRMTDFVNKLEKVRTTCEGGPSGPIGSIIKYIGCNAYGKTVSTNSGESFVLARERPDGFAPYYPDGEFEPLAHTWFATEDSDPKDYEQPHIGSFITAHVRMVVRRAALLAPRAWLYADTDCVVFDKDVTAKLDTDPKRYGAWKIENEGTRFRIIGKKVYQNVETGKGFAKGLNITREVPHFAPDGTAVTRRLSDADFQRWYEEGIPPEQGQVQRNNFIKVMAGASEMYRDQKRSGTDVKKLLAKQARTRQ